ncbi:LuxR family transcriptional regulator [Ktedonosporobacter rubrisoli]|uniref:LuxR family transcriptional regulator n=1 Tax=Ktedonosporobacter rubrisoli TaxID=2509675 RepID=A0A4P6JQQ1_KTERU|nr:LuxR C-terminal-related transcriptional regulator [Ktedonosporobacter rubrisoli]QBD77759.1 LuxR family transcriptional regulator [Ktedonosporobacter rubrisoli]
MPGPSLHVLAWSEVRQQYELTTGGLFERCFHRGDEPAWRDWLDEHTAFAFVGKAGRISLLKEARVRGAGYWYAYCTKARCTRKHYLGPSVKVTFDHLEEAALALATFPSEEEIGHDQISPQTEPGGVLFSSNLSRPRLFTHLVPRERLFSDLEAVWSHPLTLVSASAGSGKTTLLSSWVAHCSQQHRSHSTIGETTGNRAFAWLSLDALDNDPLRFWTACIAALRTCSPALGRTALAMLQVPTSLSPSTVVRALLQDLREESAEIILILDDYHVISDMAIIDSTLSFITQLPANLHLVLITRTNPEFPLSRLRVQGQMIEIHDQDLRFTHEEALRFLHHSMGLALSEEEVALLYQRTEGWVAGLQLAALALSKREDTLSFLKDFKGSHRYLLDYVQQDILARLPPGLQDFLLQTSVVSKMNAALCQAITADLRQETSQQMLEEIERANLFVVPLDEYRQWYRYHDLFREALQARLQAFRPGLVPLLHMRAARFYEATGEWREAITHALSAQDYAYAAALMEQAAAHFWLHEEASIIHKWVLSLPDVILRQHVRLALNTALRSLNAVQNSSECQYISTVAQVMLLLSRLQGFVRSAPTPDFPETEVALIKRRLRLLFALMEVRDVHKQGDTERLRSLTQEVEALPPDEEVVWNLIPLSFAFWLAYTHEGQGAFLVQRLLEARNLVISSGDHLATLQIMCRLVLAYEHAGQLRNVHQQCEEALALIEQLGGHLALAGYLYHSLFNVSYAWNRLEEASGWLQRLLWLAQEWQHAELMIIGEVYQARLGLAKGELDTSQNALRRLEALFAHEGFAGHAHWVHQTRLQVWLARGDLSLAAGWAAQTTFSAENWNPFYQEDVLMLVQILLAQRQYTQATETLERFRIHLDLPGNIETTTRFLALSVMAFFSTGERERALQCASRLFALTEPESSIRVYLDGGRPMKQALKALQGMAGNEALTGGMYTLSMPWLLRLLAAFEQEERNLSQKRKTPTKLASLVQPPLSQNAVKQMQLSPLSRQEQRVLRLLVTGMTYAEIAQELTVSLNTIKSQVSSIYRKLGVSRRAEVIAEMVRLHLL